MSKAKIFSPKGYKPPITKHGTIGKTQFRDELFIKIGARVMLTHNISISDSLVNGQIGIIVDFIKSSGSLTAVLVQFDDKEAGENYREANGHILSEQYPTATPIFKSNLDL